jgi:nucleoid-associated protein YgaU
MDRPDPSISGSTAMSKPPTSKTDFSRVKSAVSSTEPPRADFGAVRSQVSSTEATPADRAERTYTVVAGDTLSHIARRIYGKASRWPAIFDANRDQLDDPDRIRPGQVLKIPADDAPRR